MGSRMQKGIKGVLVGDLLFSTLIYTIEFPELELAEDTGSHTQSASHARKLGQLRLSDNVRFGRERNVKSVSITQAHHI